MARPSLVSPARASHLATSTLTKILELTRLHQQGQPLPSSQTSIVTKNLRNLQTLVRSLEDEQRKLQSSRNKLMSEDELRNREDLVAGLQKQCGRLKSLCDGLGIQVEGLEQGQREAPKEEMLIETRSSGDDVPLADLPPAQRQASPSIPHITIDMDDDEYEIGRGSRTTPTEDAQMDEEELRQANQDVMLMQQQMMDDQDNQLDALSKAISRQRDLSLNISSELEIHEGLLEETDQALDRTDNRLRRATRGLDTVRKKTKENSSLAFIGIIILLLLILIVLLKL